jgi:hypothetical protein
LGAGVDTTTVAMGTPADVDQDPGPDMTREYLRFVRSGLEVAA